jgi:hypothetical protein
MNPSPERRLVRVIAMCAWYELWSHKRELREHSASDVSFVQQTHAGARQGLRHKKPSTGSRTFARKRPTAFEGPSSS